MKAYHIIDTSPKTALGEKYKPQDYDVLCQVISAKLWQKRNGKIGLFTDKTGLSALGGIAEIYDEVKMLPDIGEIDNIAFWAGGKIYALAEISAPCAIIDTDFIVWDKLDFNDGITVAHREVLNPFVYPDKSSFITTDGYEFNPNWDWSVLPCNTAFMCFDSDSFKNYYTHCSKEFMNASKNCDNVLTYMVFAEQRLLSMCASEQGIPINALMDHEKLGTDNRFTHLWGYKQVLQENKSERDAFCKRCAKRIINDFPECVNILKNYEVTKLYFLGDD